MPTYVYTTARVLSGDQRKRLVDSVTAIHHEEARAPRYFVQVIFQRVEPGSIFLGGEPAPDDHVWVRADIRAGRTREQKAAMLGRVMRETAGILDVPTQSVWVYVADIPAEGILELGHVLPEPGGEAQWLASLPDALRERLERSS